MANEFPEHSDSNLGAQNPTASPIPNRDETIKTLIEDVTEKLDQRIQDALEANQTSISEVNPDYHAMDVSAVAEEVWEALNEMDNSIAGQLINGAIYGVIETSAQIVGATYDALASRYGEKLTTTINDTDSYIELVEPIVKEVQNELRIPVEMTNSTREAMVVEREVNDVLAKYLQSNDGKDQPETESTRSADREIER